MATTYFGTVLKIPADVPRQSERISPSLDFRLLRRVRRIRRLLVIMFDVIYVEN